MRINEARHRLRTELIPLYGEAEASTIAAMVIEKLTGYSRADLLLHGEEIWGDERQSRYEKYLEELKAWRPVQYVLGEAWFCGMPFFVDERVLIPRPETEELVEWIRTDLGSQQGVQQHAGTQSIGPQPIGLQQAGTQPGGGQLSIMDIGTGSGCIAITLKKYLPGAGICALDVSSDALLLARRNADALSAAIDFREQDILHADGWVDLPMVNVIVSNPPYIPRADAHAMRPNVLRHEPDLALFVDDADPLVFYRSIGLLGLERLLPGGAIYVELHEELAMAVREMLDTLGYPELELKKDLQGKWRLLRARR